MNIISWNVNGIRACEKKGMLEFLAKEQPDIFCMQETKAMPEQLTKKLTHPEGYNAYFASAKRKGYSGVAVYSKEAPLSVDLLNLDEFDDEGRTLALTYPDFVLINAYFPNSQAEGKRLEYKLRFCEAIRQYCDAIVASGRGVVLCGDYNIAHTPIDLAHPKANEKNPGYLPEERAWMDAFTGAGYIDTFRLFEPGGGHYSWWSYRSNARENNVGWRIDYHCVNPGFKDAVSAAGIRSDVYGSDHCPVTLELQL